MGSMFRGEDMVLCQMYLQADAAFNTVAQLGELGIVQFKDLKANVNVFQRQFVSEIRRCEEMERQLRFFERELKKYDYTDHEHDMGLNPETPAPRDMVDLEAIFENKETELHELNLNVETLEKNYMELQEIKNVIRYTDEFFMESQQQQASQELELGHFSAGEPSDSGISSIEAGGVRLQLNYVAGVIPMEKVAGFHRLLILATRGNIFFRNYEILEEIKEPGTDNVMHKSVFMVVFQGEQLSAKVKKIAEAYRATLYPCLETAQERAEMTKGVTTRMSDLTTVLGKSREQRDRTLMDIAQNLRDWDLKVIKLKAVFHAMNMFQTEGQDFLCECWMPYNEMSTVKTVMERASEASGGRVSSLLHPIEAEMLPSYHRTNKFTKAFQAIIDSYGVANYKEVNPALFSIITFPFLFSVMFGDAGHAIVMLVFALLLIIKETKLAPIAQSSEIFSIIFSGRYLVLVMALFSIHSGVIYNDMFSKSINIFGSKWHSNYSFDTIQHNKDLTLSPSDPNVYRRSPYEFGMDPVWQLSLNKITCTNSYKKKISVIFGVAQMTLGVILSLFNHVYFRKPLNIICEFIPQIIFLMVIFGYLCALIFTKWIIFYPGEIFYNCARNILIDFINMFMLGGITKYHPDCPIDGMFPGQESLEKAFVALAVISAIMMLLAKPFCLLIQHKRSLKGHSLLNEAEPHDARDEHESHSPVSHTEDAGEHGRQLLNDEHVIIPELSLTPDPALDITPPQVSNGSVTPRSYTVPIHHEEPFQAGEVFIHQAIHTIEFCLGCISHTASYLRLWALSLAHAELSEVLWTMVLHTGFTFIKQKYVAGIAIFVVFAPFAVLTVVILLLMEGLSAFLHTLRLHWVEFNSKFYLGDGMAFAPFSFHNLIYEKEN